MQRTTQRPRPRRSHFSVSRGCQARIFRCSSASLLAPHRARSRRRQGRGRIIASERGDVWRLRGQWELAQRYQYGTFGYDDARLAMFWARAAASQGHEQAQKHMLEAEEQRRKFQASADEGNSFAQHYVGCLLQGSAAYELIWKSAAQGYAAGEFELGRMLLTGDGCSFDEAEAEMLLRKAHKKGVRRGYVDWPCLRGEHKDPNVLFRRARLLADGIYCRKDEAQSQALLQSLANSEHASAQLEIAVRLATGKCCMKSMEEAKRWLLRAKINGAARSDFKWCRALAGAGDAESQYQFARMLDERRSSKPAWYSLAERQRNRTIKWMRSAAEQGHGMAHLELARLLLPTDEKEAEQWYRTALDRRVPGADIAYCALEAQRGDADAQFRFSEYLAAGVWFEKDLKQSHDFLQRAHIQGHAAATCKYAQLQYQSDPLFRQAYLRASANKGCAEAQFLLAQQLRSRNQSSEAVKWLKRAAEQKYLPAQLELIRLQSPKPVTCGCVML